MSGEFGYVVEWVADGRFLGRSRWMNDSPWHDDLDVAWVFRTREDAEWFLRQCEYRHWQEHTRIVPLRAPTAGWAGRIRISDERRRYIADCEKWFPKEKYG